MTNRNKLGPLYRQIFPWVGMSFVLLSAGCRIGNSFGPPGTIEMQTGRAVLHDPFPNNDVAPAILGGRPLGFDRPMPEAENNQYSRSRGATVPPYYGF